MFFTLGLVGAPFGLKGFSRVKSFSGETAHFSRLKKVTLRKNGKEEIRELAEVINRENSLLIRFMGIENPEDAAALGGSEIIAPREDAAPLNKDEFYVEDLRGLGVFTPEGEALGFIGDIIEGGGGNLAELTLPSGKKILAPFRREFFGVPDFENSRIVLLEPWVLRDGSSDE